MAEENVVKKTSMEIGSSDDADRISDLPDCLLSIIIAYLPTREAARTSLLSSQWRHIWSTSPLRLDDSSICSAKTKTSQRRRLGRGTGLSTRDEDRRVRTISRILASHRGCVDTFRLAHTRFRGRKSLVDGWFRILAEKSIQELTLHFPYGYPLKELDVPASLLACESLRTMDLMNCRFPWTTKASLNLINLRKLVLDSAEVTDGALCSVLSCCAALQSLSLSYITRLHRIHVRSRSLQTLKVRYCYDLKELFIEDAPNLEHLFGWRLALRQWLKVTSAPKLEILGYLTAQIGKLELGDTVFTISPDHTTEVSRSTLLHSLKNLTILVNFSVHEQTEVLAGLLRCFPCLQTLHILCCHMNSENYEVSDDWEPLDTIDSLDRHLKIVILTGYEGLVGELNFARFIIAKARMLKVMKFENRITRSARWVGNQEILLRLQNRASLDAQITFQKNQSYFPF